MKLWWSRYCWLNLVNEVWDTLEKTLFDLFCKDFRKYFRFQIINNVWKWYSLKNIRQIFQLHDKLGPAHRTASQHKHSLTQSLSVFICLPSYPLPQLAWGNARRHGELPSSTLLIKLIDKTVWNRISSIKVSNNHRYDLRLWFSTDQHLKTRLLCFFKFYVLIPQILKHSIASSVQRFFLLKTCLHSIQKTFIKRIQIDGLMKVCYRITDYDQHRSDYAATKVKS